MIDQDVDNFLEHFGIKGMKWGVRNRSSTSKKSSTPRKVSPDFKETQALRKKRPSELSNKELKTLNERVNLEQNFNRLNPGKVVDGKKRAEAIIATVGVAVTVYNMANSPAAKALINIGKRNVNKQLKLF